jgi:hypothetical protein
VADKASSKALAVLVESVDVAINDLLASTTCFSRLTALLSAATSLHQFVDAVQTASRLPPILNLPVHPLVLQLQRMRVNLATDLMAVATCSTKLLRLTIAAPAEAAIVTRIVIVGVEVEAAAVPKMILAVLETDVKNVVIVLAIPIVNAVAEAMLVLRALAGRRRTGTVNAKLTGETLARERRRAGGTDVIAMTGLRR